jgi:hypothetical protein
VSRASAGHGWPCELAYPRFELDVAGTHDDHKRDVWVFCKNSYLGEMMRGRSAGQAGSHVCKPVIQPEAVYTNNLTLECNLFAYFPCCVDF